MENRSPQLRDLNPAKCDLARQLGRFLSPGKLEILGVLVLMFMVAFFLFVSWRKWTDPLIDGHQWYTAWRLSSGDVLYRDVGLAYGPLSAYFNATLFKIFGPGMMILVTANLVIYSLILALIYFTFRIA